jgi:hypothetical protein
VAEKKYAKAYSHSPFIFVMANQFVRRGYPDIYWQGEIVLRWLGRTTVEITSVETRGWKVRELSGGFEEAKDLAKSINAKNGE